jgi:thiol-disulfide isomerase/thioredoxin
VKTNICKTTFLFLLISIIVACQLPTIMLNKVMPDQVATKVGIYPTTEPATILSEFTNTPQPYPGALVSTPTEALNESFTYTPENNPTNTLVQITLTPEESESTKTNTLTPEIQNPTKTALTISEETLSALSSTSTSVDAYPNPESTQSNQSTSDAYPAATTNIPAATSQNAYPINSATPIQATLQENPTSTPLISASATATNNTIATSTSVNSPSPTSVEYLTPTPSPTEVYYVTPTPNQTLSPTPIKTLHPLPPWMSSKLQATNPNTVELDSGRVQLIEFFAFWSGPSKAMAPLVHSLEKDYQKDIQFVYLDIDDPATDIFKKRLGYKKEPHFFLVDERGKIIKEWSGYVTLNEFLDAFTPYITEPLYTISE